MLLDLCLQVLLLFFKIKYPSTQGRFDEFIHFLFEANKTKKKKQDYMRGTKPKPPQRNELQSKNCLKFLCVTIGT